MFFLTPPQSLAYNRVSTNNICYYDGICNSELLKSRFSIVLERQYMEGLEGKSDVIILKSQKLEKKKRT